MTVDKISKPAFVSMFFLFSFSGLHLNIVAIIAQFPTEQANVLFMSEEAHDDDDDEPLGQW